MNVFPVEYSSLSTSALLQLILKNYNVAANSSITFLKRGFNDTYLIESVNQKYIFRVYKHNWRTIESIETELKLLKFLKENQLSVSVPIQDKDTNFILAIEAPEGTRYAVLFSYAEGELVRKLTLEQAYLLGTETGKMHVHTQNKLLGPTAQNYDIKYQFDSILATLKPVLIKYQEQYEYLLELKNDFINTFNKTNTDQLVSGICHGDLQAENFYVTNKNKFTFFDFDFFGTGYLVYDIGVFIWYDHKNKSPEVIASFLKGYTSQRSLSTTELALLPYFSTLRALFQMTLYCTISDGKQLPLWPNKQVADFIKKVEKWKNEFKSISDKTIYSR